MEEYDIDFVPGTELVRIMDEQHHDHEVLIPCPTADPHDPLNWSRKWKYLAITVQALYCFAGVTTSLSIGPMYPLFQAEFVLSQTKLNLLTGAAVLMLGYSNFLCVPLTNVFGRRFVAILLGLLAVVTSVWEARSKSYKVLLAARIVNGFSISSTETMMVQTVADLMFLRDRGMWMGVYFIFFFGGLFIGPIISSSIASRHGWRSYFWLCVAMCSFTLVLVVLAFPETKWHREPEKQRPVALVEPEETIKDSSAGGGANQSSTLDFKEVTEHTEVAAAVAAAAAAAVPAKNSTSDGSQKEEAFTAVRIPVGHGRPSKKAFRLMMKPDPRWRQFIFKDVVFCARIFFFPIILWAALCTAGCANLLLHWNITQSGVLGVAPYSFGVATVGYTNFAFLAGGLVGLATAGPVSDWYVRWRTRRNHNVREPEFRLPILVPYFVLAVVGIVVGGYAEKQGWHWAVIVVVGYGLSGVCITSVPTIATSYAVDSYKAVAGEIMVVATVIKNTCGFAMSYWVPDLTASKGVLDPVMVQLALVAGPMMLALPLYFFGKNLRRLTRKSWVHKMEAEV